MGIPLAVQTRTGTARIHTKRYRTDGNLVHVEGAKAREGDVRENFVVMVFTKDQHKISTLVDKTARKERRFGRG